MKPTFLMKGKASPIDQWWNWKARKKAIISDDWRRTERRTKPESVEIRLLMTNGGQKMTVIHERPASNQYAIVTIELMTNIIEYD